MKAIFIYDIDQIDRLMERMIMHYLYRNQNVEYTILEIKLAWIAHRLSETHCLPVLPTEGRQVDQMTLSQVIENFEVVDQWLFDVIKFPREVMSTEAKIEMRNSDLYVTFNQ